MTFDKVDGKVDFVRLEHEILEFWESAGIFERLRAKNRGGTAWSFLDGPITANNPMGVHHAWGRTLKDAFQRYFAANGRELRYQNGFDCQGLWVEVEVEKEHGFASKADIEKFGLAKFTEACKARVRKYSAIQTAQSRRLGYWMDWDDSYYTMSEENNYTIWAFLKKCHRLGHLYKGTDVMPWSGRAGSAYSHMEINEGRRLVTHTALFVRFPLRGREKEFLLVWTTTPWTLTANTGAAVSSELDYVKLRTRKDGALYYLAAANLNHQRLAAEFKEGFGSEPWPKGVPKLRTLHQIFQERGGYDIEGTVPGSALVGLAYDGPFDHLPAQQAPGGFASPMELIPLEQRGWPSGAEGHRVFDPGRDSKGSAYVVAGEGTGIVHSAPGCGDVDHIWGKQFRFAAIAPLDEEGRFIEGFGALTGLNAAEESTAQAVLADLEARGLLVASEPYPHVYPHCWRTGDPLVFRLVDEWYISMAWREEIKSMARRVEWIPPAMRGLERELAWLDSMRDWMISKKRFWGLALPIWECPACGAFEVIGGKEELRERAVAGWEEFAGHSPHRPYIDAVKIRCSACGAMASRVPDVGNPWLDAGIVAYSTTRHATDRAYWKRWIPADLVTECYPGQFRNWFYAILAMSAMMEIGEPDPRPPFRNLLGHALVLDQEQRVMHKSDGTAIWFEEAAEQIGVDTMRWMFCAQPPVADLPFGLRHPAEKVSVEGPGGNRIDKTVEGAPLCKVTSAPADETRRRVLLTLWNSYLFFCNYARLDDFDPAAPAPLPAARQDIDRWILSDLQLVIQAARGGFEAYDIAPVCQRIERFLDDLSNWYIRRNRRRFWRGQGEGGEAGRADKLAAYATLHEVLSTLVKVMAPIAPFVTEAMHRNLSKGVPNVPESVHLADYPVADETRIDRDLSGRMASLIGLVGLARSARAASNLKIRQPLAELLLRPADPAGRLAVEQFQAHILEELNVKSARVVESLEGLLEARVTLDKKRAGPRLGKAVQGVQTALAALDPASAAAAALEGRTLTVLVEGRSISLEPSDLKVAFDAGPDWAVAVDGRGVALLDRRLTPALRHEGLARDLVRQVQNLRKEADLDIEERIRLSLETENPELRKAIQTFGSYIQTETLASELLEASPAGVGAHRLELSIEGASVIITLERMGRGA